MLTISYMEFVLRTLVDIGDIQVLTLDELARHEKRSRAALIREAIDEYLLKHRREGTAKAFGLWGERKIDGIAYQEKVRGEW